MKFQGFTLVSLVVVATFACSGTKSDDSGASTGGSATTGGSDSATGGATATGGGASGGTSASGGTATGGAPSGTGGIDSSVDSSTLSWKWANATNYTSYPDPGSDECVKYNGCTWAGYFAALDDKQTEDWVKSHNIVAMFSAGDDDAAFDTYKLKTLRLRKNGQEIDVTVYDTCGDSDCDGCCTQNASQNGYDTLIDVEKYTYERFGQGDGPIEWACIDCN